MKSAGKINSDRKCSSRNYCGIFASQTASQEKTGKDEVKKPIEIITEPVSAATLITIEAPVKKKFSADKLPKETLNIPPVLSSSLHLEAKKYVESPPLEKSLTSADTSSNSKINATVLIPVEMSAPGLSKNPTDSIALNSAEFQIEIKNNLTELKTEETPLQENSNPSSLCLTLWKFFTNKVLSFRDDDLLLLGSKKKLYIARSVQTSLSLYAAYTAFQSVHLHFDLDPKNSDSADYSTASIVLGSLGALASFVITQNSLGSIGDILTQIKKYIEVMMKKMEVLSKKNDANKFAQLDRDYHRKGEDLDIIHVLHKCGAYEKYGENTFNDFKKGKFKLMPREEKFYRFLQRNRRLKNTRIPDPSEKTYRVKKL